MDWDLSPSTEKEQGKMGNYVHFRFSSSGKLMLLYFRCCSIVETCSTLCDPMDCSTPGSSVHGFSRQEHWSGCHCLLCQSCPILYDPMDYSTLAFPVPHYLPEFAQSHVYWDSDAIQPSHPLSPPFPLAVNLSQHQGLFQWVGSLHLLEL